MQQTGFVHNSHDEFFRSPFGAVCCGAGVWLKFRAFGELPDQIFLRLWRDGAGEQYLPMQLIRSDTGCYYQVKLEAPAEPGLLWYSFQIIRGQHIAYYGADERGYGGVGRMYEHSPVSYQITVYPKMLATPDWFKEAIVYQIFVDRFYNGNPDGRIEGLRKGSLVHAFWDDTPFYVRDMRTGHIYAYDFFGGNLAGVIHKLPYLKTLGVSAIYFNPIFESPSNHKYDTGDYKKIDPMFGDNRLFKELCSKAADQGIRIILDGVFSHTGSDSIYFNKDGSYPGLGAYQSIQSPYYRWYRFSSHPDKYESWWGIGTLPNVNELEPGYLDFIMHGEDSVVSHWFQHGVKGWRLDVADELPDEFIRKLRCAMKQRDPDSVLIGEVWEDASRKQSYGVTRQYLLGSELDSVTNYPFRNILLDFILGHSGAADTRRKLMSLYENYPREHFYSTLNLLGSHDVPRIITLLGEAPPPEDMTIIEQARYRLSPEKRQLAVKRLKLLSLWQFTFPGVPCIYYGDEAGVEGYTDPFNRGTYPWGNEDRELLTWYQKLTALRNQYDVLKTGDWSNIDAGEQVYAYVRRIAGGKDCFGQDKLNNVAVVLINRSGERQALLLDLAPFCRDYLHDVLTGQQVPLVEGRLSVTLEPFEGKLYLQSLSQPCAMERASGILLHPTSLPSPFGIGDLGPESRRFVDWLAAGGQRFWQVLPLNPPGYGHSPYQCYSAFAGNTLLVSPDDLIDEGLLEPDDVLAPPHFDENAVCFEPVKEYKESLLRKAFARFCQQGGSSEFQAFCREQAVWLDSYSLFMALKERYPDQSWQEWPPGIRDFDSQTLQEMQQELADAILYHSFGQFLFYRQWARLKQYANQAGVKIIGDLPIFVAYDSCDVWANRRLFELDADGRPSSVAGVPPDYFSETGQRWGNPHYNWSVMAQENYRWWRLRLKQLEKLADWIRIDHFRGFDAYWKIPADEPTAIRGKWEAGPGAYFFNQLEEQLGCLPIIAEDLGIITPSVEMLRDMFNFPGMQVLQFVLASEDPVIQRQNTVVYTGTHDNDTTVGWLEACTAEILASVRKTLGVNGDAGPEELCRRIVEYAMALPANLVITPLQDVLRLGSQARMNTPGTVGGNWTWRLTKGVLTTELALELRQLTQKHRR